MAFDTRLLTGVGVLAAVTEAGNFARAAETLGLTPSAVSRAVARLEAQVGVRLFDRNSREVSLTEEGRRFHTQVMPLLAGLDEAAAEAAGAAAVVRGRLRVSVDPWFARIVLASKLQQFLLRYPLLSVDLSTRNYREEMMTGVDVAVRFGPPDESSPLHYVAAKPSLHRRHPRKAASRVGWTEEGRRHRSAQRLRPAAMVETGGMAVSREARLTTNRHGGLSVAAEDFLQDPQVRQWLDSCSRMAAAIPHGNSSACGSVV